MDEKLREILKTDFKVAALENVVSKKVLEELQRGNPHIRDFHVSLAPGALDEDVDDLVRYALEVEEAVEKQNSEWDAKSENEKLRIYLGRTVRALRRIQDERSMRYDAEVDYNSPLMSRLSRIGNIVESTLLTINRTDTFDPRAIPDEDDTPR